MSSDSNKRGSPPRLPPLRVTARSPLQVSVNNLSGAFRTRFSSLEMSSQKALERVVERASGEKIIHQAMLSTLAQVENQKPTGALEQFMMLHAQKNVDPLTENVRSQNMLITSLMIQMGRTGARFQTASNLAAARHESRKNSIANLK